MKTSAKMAMPTNEYSNTTKYKMALELGLHGASIVQCQKAHLGKRTGAVEWKIETQDKSSKSHKPTSKSSTAATKGTDATKAKPKSKPKPMTAQHSSAQKL
uniref:Uncharacterized protein n=1 Tax=Romanomermis culicivorax TaxID=13658 RepID=A0A915JGI7_ROMCU